MTMTTKNQLAPQQGHEPQPVSSYYSGNGPIDDVIDVLEDDAHVDRDQSGRFVADRAAPFGDRVADQFDRAANQVERFAKRTAVAAQDSARSTAQAVREHPGMTAAVLGGLATAAFAGVRIYKASKEAGGQFSETTQTLRSTPKRKVALTSKTVSRKKH